MKSEFEFSNSFISEQSKSLEKSSSLSHKSEVKPEYLTILQYIYKTT